MIYIPKALFFIAGSFFGSFMNVIICRLPKGESIITPRSKCVHCQHPIPWHRNIPVLSFIFLRGKCADCQQQISWQYPVVELLTGFVWLACFILFEMDRALFTSLFISLLLAVSWIDWKTMMIPLSLIITELVIVFISLALGILNWSLVFWGAVIGVLFPLIFMGINYLITKRQGMGWGDVQLGMVLGGWIGPWKIMFTLFLASILGILSWLTVSSIQGFDRNRPLPFAPFLAFSAVLMIFYGQSISKMIEKLIIL